MKKIYLAALLIIHNWNISLGLDKAYCFKFTWPGSETTSIDCANYTNIPCFQPIHKNSKPPNTTYIWDEIQEKENTDWYDYRCELKSENVCIKYTHIYNDAIVNITYFCGKVIEDQTSAITSGCYAQYTEGYTIEACACQSRAGKMPCNVTTRNSSSIFLIFIIFAAISTPFFMHM